MIVKQKEYYIVLSEYGEVGELYDLFTYKSKEEAEKSIEERYRHNEISKESETEIYRPGSFYIATVEVKTVEKISCVVHRKKELVWSLDTKPSSKKFV